MSLSVCRSQRGHSYHINNNRGRPSHGGTFSSSSDCSGINPHTAAHRSAETKNSTLMQPPCPRPHPSVIWAGAASTASESQRHQRTTTRGRTKDKTKQEKKNHWRTQGSEKPWCIHWPQLRLKRLKSFGLPQGSLGLCKRRGAVMSVTSLARWREDRTEGERTKSNRQTNHQIIG